MAILRFSVEAAVRLLTSVPTQIIHDKKIQQAVIIYIYPSRAHRPQWPVIFIRMQERTQVRLFRNVGECSVPIVVIKRTPVDTSDKDIVDRKSTRLNSSH